MAEQNNISIENRIQKYQPASAGGLEKTEKWTFDLDNQTICCTFPNKIEASQMNNVPIKSK